MIHAYSEKSARAKLARHRAKGETDLSMVCIDGMWHVGNFNVCPTCDGTSYVYVNTFNGTTRPCPDCPKETT